MSRASPGQAYVDEGDNVESNSDTDNDLLEDINEVMDNVFSTVTVTSLQIIQVVMKVTVMNASHENMDMDIIW